MDFTVGDTKVVSGKVTANKYTGRPVMASPDVVAPLSDLNKASKSQADFRNSVRDGINTVPMVPMVTDCLMLW